MSQSLYLHIPCHPFSFCLIRALSLPLSAHPVTYVHFLFDVFRWTQPISLCVASVPYCRSRIADAVASNAVSCTVTTWVAVVWCCVSNAESLQPRILFAFACGVVTITRIIEVAVFELSPLSLQLPSCVSMSSSPTPLAVVTLYVAIAALANGPVKVSIAATTVRLSYQTFLLRPPIWRNLSTVPTSSSTYASTTWLWPWPPLATRARG